MEINPCVVTSQTAPAFSDAPELAGPAGAAQGRWGHWRAGVLIGPTDQLHREIPVVTRTVAIDSIFLRKKAKK